MRKRTCSSFRKFGKVQHWTLNEWWINGERNRESEHVVVFGSSEKYNIERIMNKYNVVLFGSSENYYMTLIIEHGFM